MDARRLALELEDLYYREQDPQVAKSKADELLVEYLEGCGDPVAAAMFRKLKESAA